MSSEEATKTTQPEKQEEEMPSLENADGPKLNKGERKCRKALSGIGMTAFTGVTRVTLRKRDNLIFVVSNPEVLRSKDGNSFAVFGELKLEDPNQRVAQKEAEKFAESQVAAAQATAAAKAKASDKDEAKKTEGEEELSEEGITKNHIKMVMDHTDCSRADAIKALKESKDDMISAVMSLTK